MSNLRTTINLFYYNIFRFECFTQFLAFYPIQLVYKLTGVKKTIVKQSRKENWDDYILSVLNDPTGGVSLQFAGMQVALLLLLFLGTLWNVFCGLLQIPLKTFWMYGGVVIMV
jgi:hypothetical protein